MGWGAAPGPPQHPKEPPNPSGATLGVPVPHGDMFLGSRWEGQISPFQLQGQSPGVPGGPYRVASHPPQGQNPK